MHVASLELTDFRSYPAVSLDLTPGTTLFLGPNGQGKTNLVEAVVYLATLGSHRVATDAPLVRAGADRAVVRAEIVRDGRRALVEFEIANGRANRARLNRQPVRRVTDVLGTVRTVLFAPEDLALVKGDPAGRRDFLDAFLVALAPRWSGVRSDVDRIVRQRTALLRSAAGLARSGRRTDLRTLDAWDDQLVRAGAELTAGRLAALDQLGPEVERAYRALSGGGAASVTYRSAVVDAAASADVDALAEALRAELDRRRGDEIDRGQCLVGPHRDDLVLGVGELPAKGYASHGESWSMALSLRLASFAVLRGRDDTGDPVLLLDDVFAELDEARRSRLADLVADAEQVLVTAAVAEDVPAQLLDSGQPTGAVNTTVTMFAVRPGEVIRVA